MTTVKSGFALEIAWCKENKTQFLSNHRRNTPHLPIVYITHFRPDLYEIYQSGSSPGHVPQAIQITIKGGLTAWQQVYLPAEQESQV